MEAMLGISLYSYLYLKLAKMLSFLLLLMSSLQQNWRRGQNRFCLEVRGVKGKVRAWRGAGGRGGGRRGVSGHVIIQYMHIRERHSECHNLYS
jgi:hypothetical protein